jgi:hypothetical protein
VAKRAVVVAIVEENFIFVCGYLDGVALKLQLWLIPTFEETGTIEVLCCSVRRADKWLQAEGEVRISSSMFNYC